MPGTTSAYNSIQFDENFGPGVEGLYWHLSRNRIIRSLLRRLPPGRVLDVGCGPGILVDHLVRTGVDCYGVELGNPPIPVQLRGRLTCGKVASELPADFRASIDCIVLGDVIEHIEKPVAFLQDLLAYYPSARSFVIAVPARNELWSNYDEYYGHYRRYDIASLHDELLASGIRPVETSYMFRLLYPAARVALWLRRKRDVHVTVRGLPIIHRAAAALLNLDFALLPRSVYGSSLICRGERFER